MILSFDQEKKMAAKLLVTQWQTVVPLDLKLRDSELPIQRSIEGSSSTDSCIEDLPAPDNDVTAEEHTSYSPAEMTAIMSVFNFLLGKTWSPNEEDNM